MVVIQHGLSMSKQPLYTGVKGTVPFLSPELFYKWDKSKGVEYQVEIFKSDVYGNGILSIEQYKLTLSIHYSTIYII